MIIAPENEKEGRKKNAPQSDIFQGNAIKRAINSENFGVPTPSSKCGRQLFKTTLPAQSIYPYL
jgi:hypothetical protein